MMNGYLSFLKNCPLSGLKPRTSECQAATIAMWPQPQATKVKKKVFINTELFKKSQKYIVAFVGSTIVKKNNQQTSTTVRLV